MALHDFESEPPAQLDVAADRVVADVVAGQRFGENVNPHSRLHYREPQLIVLPGAQGRIESTRPDDKVTPRHDRTGRDIAAKHLGNDRITLGSVVTSAVDEDPVVRAHGNIVVRNEGRVVSLHLKKASLEFRRQPLVISIEKRDDFTRCREQSPVSGGAGSAVGLAVDSQLYAGEGRDAGLRGRRGLVIGPVVHDDHFPGTHRLRRDTRQRTGYRLLRAVRRNDDTYIRGR